MSRELRAVYERGIFRPLEPVRLEEGQEVTVILQTGVVGEGKRIWEVAAEIAQGIPEEELKAVPTDGALQHDHYLYNAPKRG